MEISILILKTIKNKNIMKKLFYITLASALTLGACNSNESKDNSTVKNVNEEVMLIHDEIMPQISLFDRTTVKIDSLLQTDLEESSKNELTQLKTNLELATDNMMTWMKEYVHDSEDQDYQNKELEKMKEMKKQFEEVSLESNTKLSQYK